MGWHGWRVDHFCFEISSLPRHMAQGTMECQNHESDGPGSTAATHSAIVHELICLCSVLFAYSIVLAQNNNVWGLKVRLRARNALRSISGLSFHFNWMHCLINQTSSEMERWWNAPAVFLNSNLWWREDTNTGCCQKHSSFHVSNVQRHHLEAVEAFTFCLESNYKHV